MENSVNQTKSHHGHSGDTSPLRIITPEVIYRLDSFFEFMPLHDFRDHLIELYHNYIMHEHDSLPHNFHQLAEGMSIFFDFLKFADEECKYQRSEAKQK
jgi:hypothetical protein